MKAMRISLGTLGEEDPALSKAFYAAHGTGAMTLAQKFPDRGAVDAALDRAEAAGAFLLEPPKPVFWGGYSGYRADPDGHVREMACNPFWPLDADGRLSPP